MASMGPYGFDCEYFSVFELENEYNVHEEMFIAPGCLNTKVKMGIYTTFLILYFLLTCLGLFILGATWRSDGGWKITRIIKIVAPFTTSLRMMTFLFVLFNHRSVLKYISFALPIVTTMINASLVVAQWFLIVIRLKMFAENSSSAKGIVRSFVSSLWIFNIFFILGQVGLYAAAGAYRSAGGDYTVHNIIVGTGFLWMGILVAIFGVMIYRAGMALCSLLDGAEISNSTIRVVSTKVRWFSRVMVFIAINTSSGSLVAFLWMVATLHTERGMSGFFFLLMFVFVLAELIAPFFVWWLVLKGSAFGLRSTSDKEGDEPSRPKDVALKSTPPTSGMISSPSSTTIVTLTQSH